MGVRKAMDAVLDASKGNNRTYTLGPLIHNPQAIKMLESRNVFVAHTIDESLADETVVIRAHGITLESREKLSAVGADIVDATCPKVLKSERIIRQYHEKGYAIVIVGDRGHAEIDALLSYTGGNGVVVENIEEAKALPRMGNVCVVAQTTFNDKRYLEIAEEVALHSDGDCHIAKTVCRSTERRQADVRKLAEETDATVVVGGSNSANTRRLAEISRELGQPTYLIEDPSELNLEELAKYKIIGVTAGASTPNWVIKQVIDAISEYTPETRRSLKTMFMTLAYFTIEGNLVLCAAASALTYAMSAVMGLPFDPLILLIPFFYLFPLHAFNKYLEIDWKEAGASNQASRLRKFWTIYLSTALIFFFITLGIAWVTGPMIFILIAVSYLLGGLYSIRIIPAEWDTRLRSLRDIPGSKDIFIAGAWTFAVVILPAITFDLIPSVEEITAGIFVFALVLSRTSLLALGGIQSDKLIGHETIPVLIGKRKTEKMIYISNASLIIAILAVALTGIIDHRTLILIAPLVYMIACVGFFGRKGRFFTLYHQMILDSVFFFTGLLAFLIV